MQQSQRCAVWALLPMAACHHSATILPKIGSTERFYELKYASKHFAKIGPSIESKAWVTQVPPVPPVQFPFKSVVDEQTLTACP